MKEGDRVSAAEFVGYLIELKGTDLVVLSAKEFDSMKDILEGYPELVKKLDAVSKPHRLGLEVQRNS